MTDRELEQWRRHNPGVPLNPTPDDNYDARTAGGAPDAAWVEIV